MSAHTATPWIDGPYGQIWVGVHVIDGRWDEVAANKGVIIASVASDPSLPFEANRAFIVRSVNSHARLVDLLRRAREFVEIDATGDDDNGGTSLLGDIDALLAEVSA